MPRRFSTTRLIRRLIGLGGEVLEDPSPSEMAALPRFTRLLGDPNPSIRRAAAESVGAIGPAAIDAASLLRWMLDDEDESVRKAAARALGRLGPEVLPLLDEALSSESREVRWLAACALERLGADGISSLGRALMDPDRGVRFLAAWALGKIGAGSEEALAALEAAADEERDEWVLQGVGDALVALREGAADAGARMALDRFRRTVSPLPAKPEAPRADGEHA